MSIRPITDDEREVIRHYYAHTPADQFELADLCASLHRPKGTVCRVAAEMGLTRQVRPRSATERARMSVAARAQFAAGKHPRGMAGKRHSEAAKAAIGAASHRAWERDRGPRSGLRSAGRLRKLSDAAARMQADRAPSSNRRHWRAGQRADLGGLFFRSAWEANFARYLNALQARGEIDAWDYEPERFAFAHGSGVRSYLPDFRVRAGGETFFVEVKGWFCARSKRAARLMAQHYPEIDLRFLDATAYRRLEAEVGPSITEWERAA